MSHLGRKSIYMHRLVANSPEDAYTDHINGDKLDNRKCNLRICSDSENLMNSKVRVDNKSGYKGVFQEKRTLRWCAQINIDKVRIHLGTFSSPEEAAIAYDASAKMAYGVFAKLNFE